MRHASVCMAEDRCRAVAGRARRNRGGGLVEAVRSEGGGRHGRNGGGWGGGGRGDEQRLWVDHCGRVTLGAGCEPIGLRLTAGRGLRLLMGLLPG